MASLPRSWIVAAAAVALPALGGFTVASAQDAAAEAGVTAFDKTLRAAIAQRPPEQWRRMLDDLLELERRSRRGGDVDENDFVRLANAAGAGAATT